MRVPRSEHGVYAAFIVPGVTESAATHAARLKTRGLGHELDNDGGADFNCKAITIACRTDWTSKNIRLQYMAPLERCHALHAGRLGQVWTGMRVEYSIVESQEDSNSPCYSMCISPAFPLPLENVLGSKERRCLISR